MNEGISTTGVSKAALWNRTQRLWQEPTEHRGKIMSALHETRAGRFAMHALCAWPHFSRAAAWPQGLGRSKNHLEGFVEAHSIAADEIEKNLEDFSSFEEFFIRRLKPGSRPVDPSDEAVVSPSDGRITVVDELDAQSRFEIKGTVFRAATLLGDLELAQRFARGSLAVVYLAPSDYHWFHYPLDARLFSSKTRGRRLYSVSDVSLKNGFRPFDLNCRSVNVLESASLGTFAMVEIGAFYVGRIRQVDAQPGFKRKGGAKGYFGLGGSSVALLFERGRIAFDGDILEVSRLGRSSLVRMGEKIGARCG